MFVDRDIPAPWALPETIETSEKSHYHWNSIVIEFLVSGCHFNVNFLFDFGIQKIGVVIKLPALKVDLRRYRQHHADALKPADRSKRASAVDAWCLSPSELDDSPLVGFVSLDLVHPTRADDLVAGWNGGCRHEGVYLILFQDCDLLIRGRLPVCLGRQGHGFFKGV